MLCTNKRTRCTIQFLGQSEQMQTHSVNFRSANSRNHEGSMNILDNITTQTVVALLFSTVFSEAVAGNVGAPALSFSMLAYTR